MTAKHNSYYSPFIETPWTAFLAGIHRDTDALGQLIVAYWQPVYAFLRRRGFSRPDAEDLVQAFFARVIEQTELLKRADPGKGRSRTFLLTLLKRYVRDERALRQGRFERELVEWNALWESASGAHEPVAASQETPEECFMRAYAQGVLERAWGRFQQRATQAGHPEWAKALQRRQEISGRPSYEQLGAALGLSKGGFKNALARGKALYKRTLLEEVRNTLGSSLNAEEEVRELLRYA